MRMGSAVSSSRRTLVKRTHGEYVGSLFGRRLRDGVVGISSNASPVVRSLRGLVSYFLEIQANDALSVHSESSLAIRLKDPAPADVLVEGTSRGAERHRRSAQEGRVHSAIAEGLESTHLWQPDKQLPRRQTRYVQLRHTLLYPDFWFDNRADRNRHIRCGSSHHRASRYKGSLLL